MKTKTTRPQKPALCLSKSIATLLATTFLTATWVQAAPQGATVVSGHATIRQKGDKFTIRPSDNAIINYSSFDISPKEKVQFLQLSSSSRVLNRVTDPNPSHIFGTLQANGHVFLVNPYGVYLENGSVLNVGSFTAAAGHMSDADFLAGRDHFTDLSGSVVNRGIINAQGDISLIGGNVANFGTLVTQDGTVAMVSGTDVLIGKKDGNVFVNAAPAARKASAGAVTAGVQNAGRVRAPRALLAAGDLYAVAISNTGIIQSRQTTLQGGANSTVHVSGTIDASNKAGKGGQVKITGGKINLQKATVDASGSTGGGEILVGGDPVGQNLASLSSSITMDAGSTLRANSTGGAGGRVVVAGSQAAGSTVNLSGVIDASSANGQGGQVSVTGVHLTLQGAVIDASGATGGGEILVGGDLHGQGATPTASTTSIDAATKLKANATVQGNGGKVVVWSNQQTDYAGTLSAQGAGSGNGGNAEVSGKALLNYNGQAILTAPNGQMGTLLLDPDNIIIAAAGANTITGGLVAFGDTPTTSTISAATLVSALSTADVTLQANSDISFTTSVTSASTHGLTLQAGHSIDFGSFTLTLGGNLTATAHDPGGVGFSTANPTITSTGTINTNSGSISLTNSGGAIQVATLTSASNVVLSGSTVKISGPVNAGTFSVTGTTTLAGNVTTNTSGTNAQFYHSDVILGANVTLTTTSSQTINFAGKIDSDSTPRSLSIQLANTSNNIFFNGNIGSSAPLASLTLTGIPVFQSTATSITTTGNQLLGSQAIFFGGATTFTSTGAGIITFGKIDAGDTATTHDLTVNTAGNVTFNGAVSSILAGGVPILPINNLNLSNAAGTVTFSGGAVFTTGTQNYADAATLSTDTTFTGSTVTFGNTLAAGTHNLTITAGTISFGGTVSGTGQIALRGATPGAPTANFGISDYNHIAGGFAGLTFGRADGTGNLMFSNFALHNPTTFVDGTGDISVSTITGNFALTVNTAGTNTLSDISVASITTDAAGSTLFNGNVTTTGAQAYHDNVAVGAATTLATTNSAVTLDGTATLNGDLTVSAGSGNITFTGAVNGPNALTANSTGSTLFSSTVGATTPLASLTTDAGGTTSLHGNVTTSGAQNYGDNVTIATGLTLATTNGAVTLSGTTALGGDLSVSTGSGNITFTGALNGAHALTANSTGATLFSSTVGSTTALTSLTTNTGGGTTLNGNVTTSGAQSYGDSVTIGATLTLATTNSAVGIGGATTLNGDLTVNAGSGNITFTGAVNGAQALTANSTGASLFSSTLGNTTALTTLTTDTGGTTTLGGNVTTSGTQNYGDNVTIGGNATLATTNSAVGFSGTTTLNGNLTVNTGTAGVTFTGAVNGAHSLTANNTGATLFSSTVGATTALTALTTNAGGTTTLTGNVTTSGALQVSDNAVVATTITMTSTGDIVGFGGITTLNGDLTVNAAGNVIFAGAVNGAHALTANTSALTDFRAAVGNITALTSLTTNSGGTTSLAGNVTTSGAQQYGDNVSTTTGLTLATTNSAVSIGGTTGLGGDLTVSAGSANITFTGAVNGTHALTANSTGATLFGSTVGSTTALTSLTTNAGGTTTLSGNVTTSGTQSYGDNVTIGGTATLSTTNSAVSLSGTTTLSGDLTVSAGSGNITFTGAVNGAHALTANSTGATLFSSVVGGTTALTSLSTDAGGTTSLNGNVTTSGIQNYGDNTAIGTGLTLATTNSAVTLGGATTLNGDLTVSAGSANVTFTGSVDGAHALTANSTSTTLFGAAVGGTTALASVVTNAGGSTTLTGNVNTSGNQTYGDAVMLAADTTLTSSAGAVSLGKVDGNKFLTITANTGVTLAGAIGSTTALGLLNITNTAPITLGAGTVNTGGTQFYGGAITLTTDNTLTASTGPITLFQTVDGAKNLTINAASLATFDGAVGSTTALSSLTVSGTTSGIHMNAGTVTTTGNQTYNSETTLGAATTLTSTGNGIIMLAGVDGAQTLSVSSIGTGQVTFGGAIGATTALTSLSVTAGQAIHFNGGGVTTTGNQTYTGPAILGVATMLTSNSNGTITLGSINGAQALTVSTGATGGIIFNGVVGGTTALDTLTATGGAPIALNGGAITTNNAQSYTGNITLETATTLTSNNAGLSLGKVDGAFALTLQAATAITLGGEIGSTTRVGQLNVNGATIVLNTDLIQTSGGQFYNGSLTLGTTATLDNSGGAFFFRAIDATTDGGQGLTVSGSGNASFAGNIGGTHRLASFTLGAGLSTLLFGNISTTGNQTFSSDLTLANALTLNSNAGAISLQKVDGGGLTVSGATGVTFNAEVGSTTPLTSFNVSAPGHTIALKTDLVKTTGAQVYNNAMVLSQNTTLIGGSVTLAAVNATTAGGQSLTVTATGTTNFNGLVGGVAALSSLNVNGTGGIALNTSAITTTGAQTYTGVTTLDASTALSSTGGGAIQFLSTVDALTTGGEGLTLDTTGTVTFAQAVGQLHALQNLELTNAASTLQVNGGFLTVTDDATFDGAVQAGANALTIQAGTLAFNGPVSGTSTLTLLGSSNATGILLAGGSGFTPGPLTGATPLIITAASLGELQAGFTHLFIGSATGSLPIDAGSFSLPADTTLRSGSGAIAVSGVQSDGTPRTLDIDTTGLTTFVGSVGDIHPLAALDVSGAAAINAVAIKTTGTQTYDGAVTLGGSAVTTLTSTGGQTIAFASTIDGPQGLIIDTTASVTFPDDVGGTTPLASLSVPHAAVTIDGALVSTTGAQTYGSTVTLPANGSVLFKAGADIDITGALSAPNAAVAFQTPGTVLLASPFGTAAQPLASLTTDPLSTLEIGGANFAQTMIVGGKLVLDSDTTLTSTSGQVAFGNTVTSANPASLSALTLDVTGLVSFYGDVAYTAGGTNTAALSSLAINGATTIQFTPGQTTAADPLTGITATPGTALSIHTSLGQSYDAATDTLLGGSVTLLSDSAVNAITFTGPIDSTGGARALTVNTPGSVTFAQSLGAGSALASLTVTGSAGSGNLAGQVTVGNGAGSTFAIDVIGAVDLNAPLAVNASTTTIAAASTTIGGNITRALTSAPNMTDSFTVTGAGAIALQGDAFTLAAGGNGAIGVLDLESTGGVVTVQSLAALDTATLAGTTLVLGQLAPSSSSATITLDGGQHLYLNATVPDSGTADATILHSPASSLVLTASQSVEMGAGQKLNAASGLSTLQDAAVPIATTGVTITAPKVVLGDIATAGTLNINSADIELLGRDPIADAPAVQPNQTDLGLTLIGTSVNLGGVTPTFVPGTTQLAFIVAGAAPGFVSSDKLLFIQDSNVLAELSAFDAAHPGLQPTDGALPSVALPAITPVMPPAPAKRSAALPFNFLIDDASILALLNDDERLWFGLIDTDFAFNDDDRRHLRHRRHIVLSRVLMTAPDYQPIVGSR